jgi:hypothetical protein
MMVRFNSIRQLRQGDGADSDDCSTERVYERECAVVRISAGGPQSSDNSALSEGFFLRGVVANLDDRQFVACPTGAKVRSGRCLRLYKTCPECQND